MNRTETPTTHVLVLLEDAAAGTALLELSYTLARVLGRELSVVYVESARALVAAALPFTQVLAHAGTQWVPLQTEDVEQGFRVHVARLRELAAQMALRNAVNWSLRVTRGNLPDTAADLRAESDLLLLPAARPIGASSRGATRASRRIPVVTVVQWAGFDATAGQRAVGIAGELARALAGVVETVRVDPTAQAAGQADLLPWMARSDVLVLPRGPLDLTRLLSQLSCPVLMVG